MSTLLNELLFVNSSLFGAGSKSRQVALQFIERWREAHPSTEVTERVLDPRTMPHLDGETFAAMRAAAGEGPQDRVALSDELVAEVERADVIVLAAPMYNFSIPSTLKAWIDHIARAGRTFRYTANGPEGLLKGKKVFVVGARGGVYSGESPSKPYDFQEPYLRFMLGFLGLTDVTFIHVEGIAMGEQAAAAGLARARKAIGELVPLKAAA
jgi:FMN-dependent NADH-azoreductase